MSGDLGAVGYGRWHLLFPMFRHNLCNLASLVQRVPDDYACIPKYGAQSSLEMKPLTPQIACVYVHAVQIHMHVHTCICI